MPRTIDLKLTVTLRQMKREEAEEEGFEWSDFEPATELEAVESYQLAEAFEAFLNAQDWLSDEVLSGTDMGVVISRTAVTDALAETEKTE